tara:strand:- start:385 stop:735 length:351 start_codon:yes stop_codon:yes gene_type:complete
MKITIDTKEDSHHEIKKAIQLLSSLASGEQVYSNQANIFEESDSMVESSPSPSIEAAPEAPAPSSPAPSGGVFGNMFDASSSASEPSSRSSETPSEEGSETPEATKEDDIPEIEPY